MDVLNRRDLILRTSALAACSAVPAAAALQSRSDFVSRRGMQLLRGSQPWRYVGTNMWYAAYVGADAPYGNRPRLQQELDRLAALGVQSVRILGSSELSPLLHSVTPTFRIGRTATTKHCCAASTSRSRKWASVGSRR